VQATESGGLVSWKFTSESSDSGRTRPDRLPDWIITPNKNSVRLRAAIDRRKLNRVHTDRVVSVTVWEKIWSSDSRLLTSR
jgi:hypothetical protein